MKPVRPVTGPGEFVTVFAADQPEYEHLPAVVEMDGVVRTEWALSAEELASIMRGGRVHLCIWTFGKRLQPVTVGVIEDGETT